MSRKIRVMIIDDSLSIRLLLNGLIHTSPDMEVVGLAENPIQAMELMKTIDPDVVTLDVEMPKMDGITFLKKLMNLRPLPVVMISTLTQKGSSTAIEALAHGAVDVVGKPSAIAAELEKQKNEILDKIRNAAYAKVGQNQGNLSSMPKVHKVVELTSSRSIDIDDVYPPTKKAPKSSQKVIAIGSSTGGPAVLREILADIGTNESPPIVIVQHMGAGFTAAFARSLDKLSRLTVVEAKDAMPIQANHVYIAPGDKHLLVSRNLKGELICKLSDMDRVNRHRPAVDMLFRSLAETVGAKSTAILLTGMGNDGAICLKELKSLGAKTAVQSEETCAVFGMPRVALELDPNHSTLSPSKITKLIEETQL